MNIQMIDHVLKDAEKLTQLCGVIHGSHVAYCDAGGKSVAEIRSRFQVFFNIPRIGVSALIKGKRVNDNFILRAGQTIEFVKESGAKGLSELLTAQQLMDLWTISERQYQLLIDLGIPAIVLDGEVFHPEEAIDEWLRSRVDIQKTVLPPNESGEHKSPYLNAKEASSYLKITVKSLYAIVERDQIKPLRGPKNRYLFTTEMLDEFAYRRTM